MEKRGNSQFPSYFDITGESPLTAKSAAILLRCGCEGEEGIVKVLQMVDEDCVVGEDGEMRFAVEHGRWLMEAQDDRWGEVNWCWCCCG
ncbi:hypothetical protein V6N13_123813 [Hibiscus sabdariffa]